LTRKRGPPLETIRKIQWGAERQPSTKNLSGGGNVVYQTSQITFFVGNLKKQSGDCKNQSRGKTSLGDDEGRINRRQSRSRQIFEERIDREREKKIILSVNL